jgi:hypothetical protein
MGQAFGGTGLAELGVPKQELHLLQGSWKAEPMLGNGTPWIGHVLTKEIPSMSRKSKQNLRD